MQEEEEEVGEPDSELEDYEDSALLQEVDDGAFLQGLDDDAYEMEAILAKIPNRQDRVAVQGWLNRAIGHGKRILKAYNDNKKEIHNCIRHGRRLYRQIRHRRG